MPIHAPSARPHASAAAALLCALSPGATAAGPAPTHPPPIALQVVGACPDEAVVAASLRRLLPRRQVTAMTARSTPSAGSLPVRIEDLGPSYRVTVSSLAQEFRDAQRDCAE